MQQFPDSINTPELKLPIDEEKKFRFIEKLNSDANFKDGVINSLDGLRIEFEDGWGLIRPSNTSPYLILRFEADTQHALVSHSNTFSRTIISNRTFSTITFLIYAK